MKIRLVQQVIDAIRGKGRKKKVSLYENGELKIIKVRQKSKYDIKAEQEEKKLKKFTKEYIPPQNTYKKVICACGFGDSGSGAVTDLLSEFDNITVIGDHDIHGGSPLSKDKKVPRFEVDIFRCYGGLFDLEGAFEPVTHTSIVKILAFLNAMEYYYKTPRYHICNDKFMELVYEFIDNITTGKIEASNPLDGDNAFIFRQGPDEEAYSNIYNPFVFDRLKKRYYWMPKDITKKQYRAYAKEFITKFLNTIESKEYLALDQFVALCGCDFGIFKEYIDNCKIITIYRDPRDVYCQAMLVNHLWVPSDPDEFITWYKGSHIDKYISANDPDHLCVRFEDTIFDYENTTDKIINLLEIDKSHHINKKVQFRPEFSKRNVGLYKAFENQDIIKYIEDNLKEFCYYGKND